MKIPAILSSVSAAVCVGLSIWLFIASASNHSLQSEFQKRQQELLTQQQQVQLQQQQLQQQQEQISAGAQLAQQIGPAVLNDLGTVARTNNNEKIKTLLSKYGVTIKDEAAAGAATPKPATP